MKYNIQFVTVDGFYKMQFLLQTSKFIAQIICDQYGHCHCVANIPKWSDIDKNKHSAYAAFMCRLESAGNLIT